jgi:hypothetical protein
MQRQYVLMLMVPMMWGRAVRWMHLAIVRGTPLPFRWLIGVTICTLIRGGNTDKKNLALRLSVALSLSSSVETGTCLLGEGLMRTAKNNLL